MAPAPKRGAHTASVGPAGAILSPEEVSPAASAPDRWIRQVSQRWQGIFEALVEVSDPAERMDFAARLALSARPNAREDFERILHGLQLAWQDPARCRHVALFAALSNNGMAQDASRFVVAVQGRIESQNPEVAREHRERAAIGGLYSGVRVEPLTFAEHAQHCAERFALIRKDLVTFDVERDEAAHAASILVMSSRDAGTVARSYVQAVKLLEQEATFTDGSSIILSRSQLHAIARVVAWMSVQPDGPSVPSSIDRARAGLEAIRGVPGFRLGEDRAHIVGAALLAGREPATIGRFCRGFQAHLTGVSDEKTARHTVTHALFARAGKMHRYKRSRIAAMDESSRSEAQLRYETQRIANLHLRLTHMLKRGCARVGLKREATSFSQPAGMLLHGASPGDRTTVLGHALVFMPPAATPANRTVAATPSGSK